ncbi:MAG: ribonuclease H [Bacteroidetes bacterium]|nr:MAG: ribonuclease H [Bacteroidota bacterium]
MSKKKQKYYVVWKGNKPGVYTTWEECKKQVHGFASPVFKAFQNIEIAKKAYTENPGKYMGDNYIEPIMLKKYQNKKIGSPIKNTLSVDAACSGNPGPLEYQGVDTASGKLIFHQGPFPLGTVNIGEFLALVHGLALLKSQNNSMPIYSDSMTAMSWVRKKAIKTNLERNAKTEDLFKMVDRALIWIKSNTWENKILKWETAVWGEIPADFGRK